MHGFIGQIQNFFNELSVLFGSIVQFLILKKKKVTLKDKFFFFIFLLISSIFTAFYIVAPIVEHYHLEHTKLETSLYAISSLISIEIISGIIILLPKVIKDKIKERFLND